MKVLKKKLLLATTALIVTCTAFAQGEINPSKISQDRKNHTVRTVNPEAGSIDPSITRENLTEEVYVPNLIGQNVNRMGFANDLSRRSRGFSAKVSEEKDGTGLAKGQILSQSPKPGTQLRRATEIQLVVASGR
jgi:hypothetical protein